MLVDKSDQSILVVENTKMSLRNPVTTMSIQRIIDQLRFWSEATDNRCYGVSNWYKYLRANGFKHICEQMDSKYSTKCLHLIDC